MIEKFQLAVGLRFDLASRRGHYYRLQGFVRPAKVGEQHQYSDRIDGEIIRFVDCSQDDATHVRGWESYICLPSIHRILEEGNLMPNKRQRWVFTDEELATGNLFSLSNHDGFLARPFDVDSNILVNRCGESTGQYEDGSFGVSDEDAEAAAEEDILYSQDDLHPSVCWMDVLVSDDDKEEFIALALPPATGFVPLNSVVLLFDREGYSVPCWYKGRKTKSDGDGKLGDVLLRPVSYGDINEVDQIHRLHVVVSPKWVRDRHTLKRIFSS